MAEADEFYAALQPAALTEDERRVQRQAFAGLLWSQAVLLLRRGRLAARRPGPAAAAAGAQAWPEPRVGALQRGRHHVDARHLGVSLVRGLGSGVPLHPVRPDRPRLRQGAVDPARARVVPAPERPDPGLRVGVRRRQPAGAGLGGLARLQDRPEAAAARATALSWSASSTSCC